MTTIEINEGEMVNVLLASLVRRLRGSGWTKSNAERLAEKALAKTQRMMPAIRTSLCEELMSAHEEGASRDTLRTLITSAYAVAGVEIADDLTRSSIAERN